MLPVLMAQLIWLKIMYNWVQHTYLMHILHMSQNVRGYSLNHRLSEAESDYLDA
jgi:hypothetical protein